jgi:hypothetical protein
MLLEMRRAGQRVIEDLKDPLPRPSGNEGMGLQGHSLVVVAGTQQAGFNGQGVQGGRWEMHNKRPILTMQEGGESLGASSRRRRSDTSRSWGNTGRRTGLALTARLQATRDWDWDWDWGLEVSIRTIPRPPIWLISLKEGRPPLPVTIGKRLLDLNGKSFVGQFSRGRGGC